jgi:hypothetical protein
MQMPDRARRQRVAQRVRSVGARHRALDRMGCTMTACTTAANAIADHHQRKDEDEKAA